MASGFLGQRINQYIIMERKGLSLNVYLAKDEASGKEAIVKVFATNLNAGDQKAVDAEIKVGMRISQTCIFLVKYEEMIIKKDHCFLIMEHCKFGDLAKMFEDRKKANATFSDDEIFCLVFHVGYAVQALHKENIVHRDLKPENIFQTENKVFKVGDFGISRTIDPLHNKTTVVMSSTGYAPPEVLDGETKLAKSMDIFALGCIILQVIDMHHPFANEQDMVQQSRVFAGRVNPARTTLTSSMKSVRDFALRMVSMNPTDRPPIEDLVTLSAIVTFGLTQYINSLSSSASSSSSSSSSTVLEPGVPSTQHPSPKQAPASAQPQAPVPARISIPIKYLPDKNNEYEVVERGNPTRCEWDKDGTVYWAVLDQEMSTGIYNMTLECSGVLEGIMTGLVSKSAISKRLYTQHIPNLKGTCCIFQKGLFWGNNDCVRIPLYPENGKVTVGVELNVDTHIAYFFVDGKQILYSINNIPPGVHFGFSNCIAKLTVDVTFEKLATPTVDGLTKCTSYQWK